MLASACMHERGGLSYRLTAADCSGDVYCEAMFASGEKELLSREPMPDEVSTQSLTVLRRGDPGWSAYALLSNEDKWTYIRCRDVSGCERRQGTPEQWSGEQRKGFSIIFDDQTLAGLAGPSAEVAQQHSPSMVVRRCRAKDIPRCQSAYFPNGDTTTMALLFSLWR